MTLPTDLETLGNRLEVAALRAVRRRARRQLVLNAICALAITVPVALAVATTGGAPIAPPAAINDAVSETLAVSSPPPAADMAVRRIPDGWPPRDDPKPACLDGNDCGRPVPPTRPVSYPEPPRRGPRP